MSKKKINLSKTESIFQKIILLILSILLWSFAFPSLLSDNGLGFFGWIALIPIFTLLFQTKLSFAPLWGFAFGFLSYFCSQFWLLTFHPGAMFFVGVAQGIYFVLLFTLFRWMMNYRLPAFRWVISLVWVAYEYLKCQGFLAYPFGLLGATQAHSFLVKQMAAFGGVWLIAFFMVLPQVFIADRLALFLGENGLFHLKSRWLYFNPNLRGGAALLSLLDRFTTPFRSKKHYYGANFYIYFILLFLAIGGGFLSYPSEQELSEIDSTSLLSQPQPNEHQALRLSLIQTNAGIDAEAAAKGQLDIRDHAYRKKSNYEADLALNIQLTKDALSKIPDCVVWSETSLIPGVDWYQNGGIGGGMGTVSRFCQFNQTLTIPIITGNSNGQPKDPNLWRTFDNRVDYNSALLVQNGEIQSVYSKQKLVPFTENYPFGSHFPKLRSYMEDKLQCAFWEKGKENVLFEVEGRKLAIPICYEDGFPNLIRSMTKEGAEAFVNITNDSWSGSLVAQKQHLNLAILRAIEVRRPFLRATQSGQTVAIASSGKVIAELPAFISGNLTVDLYPTPLKTSIYQIIGDIFPQIACTFSLLWFILLIAKAIQARKTKKN